MHSLMVSEAKTFSRSNKLCYVSGTSSPLIPTFPSFSGNADAELREQPCGKFIDFCTSTPIMFHTLAPPELCEYHDQLR